MLSKITSFYPRTVKNGKTIRDVLLMGASTSLPPPPFPLARLSLPLSRIVPRFPPSFFFGKTAAPKSIVASASQIPASACIPLHPLRSWPTAVRGASSVQGGASSVLGGGMTTPENGRAACGGGEGGCSSVGPESTGQSLPMAMSGGGDK